MDHRDETAVDERPRGTVVVVSVFGVLLVLGWLLMFFGLFVPRGTS
ncbi:MAG: cytochrome c oxidase subunit 2A [Gammaproteobacteria bacterium]|nr:cytochrome c oxidase subunit 2A [Gammaproteobacteria bacterium]